MVLMSLDNAFRDDGSGSAAINADIGHVEYLTDVNSYSSEHGHWSMSLMAARHDGNGVTGIAPDSTLWSFNAKTASQNGIGFEAAIEQTRDRREGQQRVVFQGGVQGNWPWTSMTSRRERSWKRNSPPAGPGASLRSQPAMAAAPPLSKTIT